MSVVLILILIGLVLVLGFLLAFLWALKSGQFDDLETPRYRSLF